MRISRLFSGIFVILLASCGGDDGEENPSTGATTGGDSSSQTTGTGTGGGATTGAGGGATTGTGGDATTGTGGDATTGTGGDATTGTGGDATTGTGGDATTTSTTGTGGGDPVPPASGLPVPPGAGNVPKPSGAVGGFKVLDWAGFTGAVSYSFDDTNSSQIQNYDKLNALGVPFTFYLQTNKTNEINSPVWPRAVQDGHEIGNHTHSHSSQDDGSDTDAATRFLEQKFGIKVWTMAAPNGSGVYTGIARTRFLINRGVANAVIRPNDNTDPFTLPSYIPPTGASAAAMDQEVAGARQQKGWRTFCIHGFTGGSDGAYQPIPLQAFLDHVENTKKLGDVWIDSIVNIGAYWRGQKAVTEGARGQTGAGTITWKLPDNFPPGKYVRVTVTGGTLTQNGVPLTWDPHGYYEMALDPGSVTLSP